MRVRNLGVIIARSFLSMLLFSLVFFLVIHPDGNRVLDDIIHAVYGNAKEDSQSNFISKVNSSCNLLLGNEEEIVQLKNVCSNKDKLNEIKNNCATYNTALANNAAEKSKELDGLCNLVMSNDIELKCSELSKGNINISEIGITCEKFQNNLISKEEFLSGYVLSGTNLELDSIREMKSMITALILLSALIILIILALLHKLQLFPTLSSIGTVFINVGILLLVFSAAVNLYLNIGDTDTSIILDSFGSGSMAGIADSAPKLVPLFLAGYIANFLIIGILALSMGIVFRIIFRERKTKRR